MLRGKWVAGVLTGTRDVEAAARALGLRCGEAIVKDGAAGAVWSDGLTVEAAGCAAVQVLDSTGAGDAFAAGFLYGHHEGMPVEASLKLAHASAAASLRSVGTTGSVETAAGCLALAERWGWRSMPA